MLGCWVRGRGTLGTAKSPPWQHAANLAPDAPGQADCGTRLRQCNGFAARVAGLDRVGSKLQLLCRAQNRTHRFRKQIKQVAEIVRLWDNRALDYDKRFDVLLHTLLNEKANRVELVCGSMLQDEPRVRKIALGLRHPFARN